MADKFEDWRKYTSEVDKLLKQYLNQMGIPPAYWLIYFSFSKKILSIVRKYQDRNIINQFVEGNIQYYKITFGGDEKILRGVAKIVILAKVEGKKPEEILKEVLGETQN